MKMKLSDMFDFVVNLNEVFDTRIPVEEWKHAGNDLQGEFTFNNVRYVIHLQPLTINPNNHKYNIINIGFSILDQNGIPSQQLTYNNPSGSAVIGAIAHAILDKISDFQYDAILFGAIDNIEKRMKIYQAVITYLKPGSYVYDFKTKKGRASLMFDSYTLTKEQQSEILNFFKIKE